MELPATFQQHPYAWGGGAAALVVLWLYARNSSAASAPAQTAVVSSTLDPTAAALTAQQMQDNVALTTASLQAQTQVAGINAATQINASNNAAAIQAASINANVVNAQTAASIFTQASNAELASQSVALAGTSTAGGDFLTPGEAAPNPNATNYSASGLYIEPWDAGWQSWMGSAEGQTIPIMSGTSGTGQATNATSNQIEEMFNNVIRAGQGTAPLQTVTMQPSGGPTQVGTATIDPVFAVWDGSSSVPTITDVTLNPASQYGYTGSVFNPATGNTATNITPNAVPAGAALLPTVTPISMPQIPAYQ